MREKPTSIFARLPKGNSQGGDLVAGFGERLRLIEEGLERELESAGQPSSGNNRLLNLGDGALALLASAARQVERGRKAFADRLPVNRKDEFGFDPFFQDLLLGTFRLLYHFWWRVEVRGIENVPSYGPLVLVSNHSRVLLPGDAGMIIVAMLDRHPARRRVRALLSKDTVYAPGARTLLERSSLFCTSLKGAAKVLAQEQAIVGFPEGGKGAGKYFGQRHQLLPFTRKGLFTLAARTGAQLVPVAVAGGEGAYPVMARWRLGVKAAPFSYLPTAPTFPWLGFLGLVPFPAKCVVSFGKPVDASSDSGRESSGGPRVNELSSHVRGRIKQLLRDCGA